MIFILCVFFFFKQKTAYEMRISDWSSDVCSSDLLDEQAAQILAMTDDIAEGARKIGGTTIRSIGHFARLKHIEDNDADFVTPEDMMAEPKDDNLTITQRTRKTHHICDGHGDVATASLIENWIDLAGLLRPLIFSRRSEESSDGKEGVCTSKY